MRGKTEAGVEKARKNLMGTKKEVTALLAELQTLKASSEAAARAYKHGHWVIPNRTGAS